MTTQISDTQTGNNNTANHDTVVVTVKTEYLEDKSVPDDDYYVYAYHIHIHNQSKQIVQLRNRTWIITDANGQVKEIQGDGVIGKQPIIQAGSSHFYTSWSVMNTPIGCMEGKYGMRILNSSNQHSTDIDFYALVPIFTLAVPGMLN